MKIDGKEIAEHIFANLRIRVATLTEQGITPHLAVILIGENPASMAYVLAKQKSGEKINAKVSVFKYDETITTEILIQKVVELNTDSAVHGILIQRPVPEHITIKQLEYLTDPKKDIDGFHLESPFTLPLPLAVIEILGAIYMKNKKAKDNEQKDPAGLLKWLTTSNIVVIGKGEAGGKPILEYFNKLGINPPVIDSKTPDPKTLLKNADIIISAVGRAHVITPEMLKKDVILIGVGIHKDTHGKLHGDYEEKDIAEIASYYTPTPGGVGPVNVAMLLNNVVTATEEQTNLQ